MVCLPHGRVRWRSVFACAPVMEGWDRHASHFGVAPLTKTVIALHVWLDGRFVACQPLPGTFDADLTPVSPRTFLERLR
jgi:hypothetical protein